jgi:hypothetical protein
MKTLIYQVAVGNVPAHYEICIESVSRYCKKYDIDHVVQREPILNIKPLNNQRSGRASMSLDYLPIYEKENAFNYLSEYDMIAIVDADIYIRAPYSIFDEIEDGVAFAGVRECDLPLTPKYLNKIQGFSRKQYEKFPHIMKENTEKYGVPFYNMGLMVLTQHIREYIGEDSPEQFIRRKEFEGFVNGEGHWQWSTDQTLLNYWVKTSNMPAQNLHWHWNVLYEAVKKHRLPEAFFVHFILSANLPRGGKEIPKIISDLDYYYARKDRSRTR